MPRKKKFNRPSAANLKPLADEEGKTLAEKPEEPAMLEQADIIEPKEMASSAAPQQLKHAALEDAQGEIPAKAPAESTMLERPGLGPEKIAALKPQRKRAAAQKFDREPTHTNALLDLIANQETWETTEGSGVSEKMSFNPGDGTSLTWSITKKRLSSGANGSTAKYEITKENGDHSESETIVRKHFNAKNDHEIALLDVIKDAGNRPSSIITSVASDIPADDSDYPSLLLPYYDQGSLQGKLENPKAQLTIDDIYNITDDLSTALYFLHSNKFDDRKVSYKSLNVGSDELDDTFIDGSATSAITHNDITPGNILLSKDEHSGRLKATLSDFGSAYSSKAASNTNHYTKTPGSMSHTAPESLAGERIKQDTKDDVWALGLIINSALSKTEGYTRATEKPSCWTTIESLQKASSPFEKIGNAKKYVIEDHSGLEASLKKLQQEASTASKHLDKKTFLEHLANVCALPRAKRPTSNEIKTFIQKYQEKEDAIIKEDAIDVIDAVIQAESTKLKEHQHEVEAIIEEDAIDAVIQAESTKLRGYKDKVHEAVAHLNSALLWAEERYRTTSPADSGYGGDSRATSPADASMQLLP